MVAKSRSLVKLHRRELNPNPSVTKEFTLCYKSAGNVFKCKLYIWLFSREYFYTRILRDTCQIYYYFQTELVLYSSKLTIYGFYGYGIIVAYQKGNIKLGLQYGQHTKTQSIK